ncbi:hypothetical protein QR680_005193 [Steinernema hermaphroditum]|uniref:FAD dependent oxidoreductase domain-containing protein n=1 Tax=Steinernema hermaphroditum TaxID=289476 RepID=A0AA39HR58_9BILA|nr:hypothetical protein QR680_005193 [Steinernema hermaphroditum]
MVWNVCVIGAGINGLGTARELQRRFGSQVNVTIVTEKTSPDTTSDVAAGLWMPYLINDERPELLQKWGEQTFEHMAKMEREPGSGAFLCSGYEFYDEPKTVAAISTYRCFRNLTRKEIDDLGFGEFKYGNFRTTYFLEPTIYLKKIHKEFQEAGGKLFQHRLKSVDEIAGRFDLIVNCAGLGSRELFGDKEVKAIRGQVIRVRCPALKHFYVIGDDVYCLPNHTAVLGGTHDEDDYDLTVRPEVAERILNENQKYIPVLKDAEIVKHRVGLRPYRKNVRVEVEHYKTKDGKKIPIVHNYGQGGSGITMFYGCALHAVDLAEAEMKNRSKI